MMVTNNTDIILGCMVHNDNGLINNHQAKSERPSAKVSKKIQILVCVCVCVLCIHVSWCLVGFSKDHLSFFVFVLFVAQSTFCFCFVVVFLLCFCFCPCCQLSFSTKTPQSPSKHCVYEMWQICDLG